jgi:peptide/nickel transport system substrate-binding protein
MNHRRRPAALLLLVLVAAVARTPACDRAGGDDGSEAEGPPEGGGTVVIGVSTEPDNLLDVVATTRGAQDIIEQMFLPLVEVGEDLLTFEPALARSWDVAPDALSITYHLAPDARWHDGVPVTAHDVRFTWELHVDPAVGYAARSWKEFIADVVVVDDRTVAFRFDRRYPYQHMDASAGLVLPKHLLESVPRGALASCAFARHPIGNGPFRFVQWEAQQFVELAANEDCFLGRPHLDRLVFRVVPDRTVLLTQLETGSVDVMEDPPPHEVPRLEQLAGVRVERFSNRTYTYIGWNSANPLFASANVRRALGMAIDRDAIIEGLCHGYARPALGPIHPELWAYDEDLPALPHDPGGARRLLAEEGWSDADGDGWLDRDGRTFEFELKTNHDNQVRMDAAVMIQSQLQEIGVKVVPRNYEWSVLWDAVIRHAYETAVLVGWNVGLKVDMKAIWHSASIDGKFNHTGYANPEVDRLIDEALSKETLDEARPLWERAQRLVVEDQPYTFLFILDKIFAVNDRVRGTHPDFRGYYRNLEEWWIPASLRRQRGEA